jgi:thiamine-phosphate pyrophosphorylase
MVQLRLTDIDPRELIAIARMLVDALPVPVIVNSRADVALAAGAAGVHVGVEEVPAVALRRVVPPGFIIGTSIGSDDEVPNAEGADYVGVGPVFAAGSAPDAHGAIGVGEFARLAALARLPAIGIGGVDETNARQLRDAGASGVAVIRAIFAAADPERAARALSSAIGS